MRKTLQFSVLCLMALGALCWAAAILNQTTAEADARLVEAVGDIKSSGFRLTRSWPWLQSESASGTSLQGLLEAVNDISAYTNPLANGQTYTGIFVHTESIAIDENRDGTDERHATILQTLTRVMVPTNVGDLTSLGKVIKNQDEEILNYLQFNEGTNQNIWHVYPNIDPARRTVVMAFNPTEAGHRIIKKEFRTEKDNTGTFLVTFETNRWVNFSGNYAIQTNVMREVNYDPDAASAGLTWRQTKMADGLYKDRAENIRDNSSPDANWFLDDVQLIERDNGEYALIWDQTKERGTNEYIVTKIISNQGRQQEEEVVNWFWLTEANADLMVLSATNNETDTTGAYPASPASHRLRSVEKSPNENGSFNVERRTFIPNNTGSAVWPETSGRNYTNFYIHSWRTASITANTGDIERVKFTVYADVHQYWSSLNSAWAVVNNDPETVYISPPSIRRVGSGKYATKITYRLPVDFVVTNISLPADAALGIGNNPWVITNEVWQFAPWRALNP